MQSYTSNGIKYFSSKFIINNYECFYEYYYSNNQYYVYLYNYNSEELEEKYMFINSDLTIAKKQLRKTLKKIILANKINDLISLEYKIFLVLPDVLKDCFCDIAYHISPIKNTKSILQNGLVPSFDIDPMVKNANLYINKNKPKNINFNREECVYFHPQIENDLFSKHEKYYTNSALFAVDIKQYINNAIIASEGISGFCMWDENFSVDFSDIEKWSKKYWQVSKNLKEYLEHPPKYSSYDLSEILIPSTIKKEDVHYLGFWNEKGEFKPTRLFKNFIKDEYKENYVDILNKYF